METAIQMFRFDNKQEIRVVQGDDGELWFVASGVCKALEYTNTSKALSDHVDSEDIAYFKMLPGMVISPITRSYTPGMSAVISEPGLYALTFSSTLPEAKRFRKWVTTEVLPAIRKTGFYSIKPMSPAELLVAQAQMMLDHERRLAALEEQMQAQQSDRKEAEQLMLALPEPTVPAPEKTTRANLNERVRSSAKTRQLPYSFIWNQLYKELKYRKSFDVETRAQHCKKERLDIIEEAGLLPDLYAIACEVLQ